MIFRKTAVDRPPSEKRREVDFFIFPKKCIGPCVSEKFQFFRKRLLGQMLRKNLLGRPGGSGGASGGVRGGPGGVLGGPGGVRGGLGRVLGGLGAILERPFEPSDFGLIFVSILNAKRVPKGSHLGRQNGAKIDPKTIQNRSRFARAKKIVQRASWGPLEAILGHFWRHLGVKKIVFSLVFVGVPEKR